MKIKELLSDDELYELCVLMNEIMWQALMANSLPRDVQEGYRSLVIRRPARRVPVRIAPSKPPMVPIKPFPKPKPLYPVRTKISSAQRLATNPNIDPLNGFNARLDNHNLFPELSDKNFRLQ